MIHRRLKYLIYFLGILCLFCISQLIKISLHRKEIILPPQDFLLDVGYPFHPKSQQFSTKCAKSNRKRFKTVSRIEQNSFEGEDKYITTMSKYPGGLGNIIWRFASLYGIGRDIGRKVYLDKNMHLHMDTMSEIEEVFPNMAAIYHIKHPTKNQIITVDYAKDCCRYEDPIMLKNIIKPYIKIAASYLQSYLFFDKYKKDIREIFECGKNVMEKVNSFVERIFDKDDSFKLCVHTRRSDFLADDMLESKYEFIEQALKVVLKRLQKTTCANISLVIFGDDFNFIQKINVNNLNLFKAHAPQNLRRSETMCLGINYCDSMLMTASGSTFAWWISYLMPENSPIFYNSQISDYANHSKDVHDFQIFPENWIRLSLENGKVRDEPKWWYERNNWNREQAEKTIRNEFIQ